MKMTVSGQINRALLVANDGSQTDVYHVDNDASSTRFRILGDYAASKDINIGAAIEMQIESNSSASVNQTNREQGIDTNITNRRLELTVASMKYGKLWLGQGSTATDGTSEQDLSGTTLAGYSNVEAIAGGMLIRSPDDGELTTVSVGDIYNNIDGLGRTDRLRYDTPNFSGFSASFGANQGSKDGTLDAALKYAGKVDGVEVAAAIGYADGGLDNGTTEINHQFNGSGSVLFKNGLNFTLAGGIIGFVDPTQTHRNFLYSKFGYQFDAFGFGKSAVSVDAAPLTYGTQFVQRIDEWKLETYLGYRQFIGDIDIKVGMLGARVKF